MFYFEHVQLQPKAIVDVACGLLEEYQRLMALQKKAIVFFFFFFPVFSAAYLYRACATMLYQLYFIFKNPDTIHWGSQCIVEFSTLMNFLSLDVKKKKKKGK